MGSLNIDLLNGVIMEYWVVEGDYGDILVWIYCYEEVIKLVFVFIFYYGGGFVGGMLVVVENFCKGIVEKLLVVVINVDYYLVFEFLVLVVLKDCYRVFEWVVE